MKKIFLYASVAALVLGSCTKEVAETVAPAPSVEGNSSVIVSFNTDDETTRTHLGESAGSKKPYEWDEADAIGVFAAAEGDATNATFKYVGMTGENGKAEFKGSLEFFETEEYIVYYPYTPTSYKEKEPNAVLAGKKIRMNIPATQLYNFEEKIQSGDYAGSFAQNTAPAVGVGTVEDGKLVVKLKGAASYIFFPIKGTGFIKKLELSISDVEHLNGYNQVLVDTESDDFGFKAPSGNGSGTIVLNCGVKGVELDPETATNFWFVVPNLKLENATITAIVNGNEELKIERKDYTSATATGAWYPNTVYRIFDVDAEKKANTPWYIDVPDEDEDDFIIDNEYKFLEYAYAATVGGENIPEIMKNGNNLKAAKIVTNLDFSDFTFAAEGSDFRKAVAAWYNNADGVIPTIGGAKAFTIKGAKADVAAVADAETPAAITITGLKVNGVLFNDADGKNYTNAVENIVLVNLEVAGSEYILANRVYKGNGTITISNVTVESCTAPEGAAVIGRAFTNTLGDNTITNNTDYIFANELNIMEDYKLADLPEGFKYNGVIVNRSTSAGAPENGKIVTVADAEAAAAFINDVANTTPSKAGQKAAWYSVKDANGTFYYTGTAATDPRKDEFTTAEEFAYYIEKGGEYELTNSIDMMGEEVEAKAEYATVTVKEGADVAISNVVVESAYLLAKTGTATGVNVEATYTATGYVGGLFFEADVDEAGKTTACTVTAKVEAAEKFGAYYAKVYVTLGTENTLTLSADFVDDNAPYGAIVCKAPKAPAKLTGEYTNIYFKDGYSKEQLEAIAARIEWEWAENAQIPDGYYLQMISENTTVKSDPFEFKVNNDESLNHAITYAKTGETVTVEPGTYTTLPKPGAEGVTIDATGATFDGVVADGKNIDLNGGELIGATFTGNNFNNGVNAGTINGTFTKCKFVGGNTADDDGIYGYSASTDVVFDGCEFTAGDTAAQVLAKDGAVTYKSCIFNGFVSASGDKGTTFESCRFNVGPAGFAGGNFWAKTTVTNTTFNFVQYDPEKSATDPMYYNWISLTKHDDVDTYNFTDCKVLNKDGEIVEMSAKYVFQIAQKYAGTVVNIDGVQITLKATVKEGAAK